MIRKLAAILFLVLALPLAVSAQGLVPCGVAPDDPCQLSDLFSMIYLLVNFLIGMAALVSILFVVWGGVTMLLSAGNTSRVQEAKATIFNAIIGLVLTLLSYLIVSYVAGLFIPGAGDPLQFLTTYL